MKRLSIALTAIGLSASAFAAWPAATDPTLVAVPQLPGGLVIGGSAFYLQPSATHGDLAYASVDTGPNGLSTSPFFFHSSLKSVEPGYDWAWGVNVGYIFPNTGNDINVNWFTFSTDDHASTSISPLSPTNGSIQPISIINDLGGTFFGARLASASSKAQYDLDQVDLTAGQFIDVGCRLILHPNVGLRWADLERKLNNLYLPIPTVTVTELALGFLQLDEKSDFSGIGPLAGIDASYYIGMGFGAVAHVDSALLVGNIDAKDFMRFQTDTLIPNPAAITVQPYNADNIQRIVPVVDAKLGLDYTFVFNNAANTDLTLEGGWKFSNYFNAVDRLKILAPGAPGTVVNRITSDFALQGPYVNLTLHV